jgi:cobyrinic acid a,c-diamide synthase
MAELVAAHVDLDAVVALATPLPDGPAWDPVTEAGEADGVPDPATRYEGSSDTSNGHPQVTGPERGAHRPGSADSPSRIGELTGLDRQTRRVGSAGSPGSIGTLAGSDRHTRGVGERPVVGVFGGAAFTFGYAEHVELLTAAGAEVVVVDPLRDEALPSGIVGLVLPGGFPEEHAAALGANRPLRDAVRELAASGAPVHAECAGLLYLCESLDGAPMCGVLPARAAMSDRLTLGYRDAVALGDSALFATGERVTGHEFHRCAVEPRAGAAAAWAWRGATPDGWVVGGVHASFLHTHAAGHPRAVRRFMDHCTPSNRPR